MRQHEYAGIAQLVEHRSRKAGAISSSLIAGSRIFSHTHNAPTRLTFSYTPTISIDGSFVELEENLTCSFTLT